MSDRDEAMRLAAWLEHLDGPGQLSKCLRRQHAEIERLRALLLRCRPVVESEMALMDSMARHMAGGFDPKDVKSADNSADFHWILLRDIAAEMGGSNG